MRLTFKLSLTTLFAALVLFAAGCAKGPKPQITDQDSYQEVSIGPIHYQVREGTTVSRKGPGFVEHSSDRLPGLKIRVEYDSNPPVSLKRDADVAERRFLRQIAKNSWLRSTQYDVVDNKEVLKCFVEGETKDKQHVYGSMMMLRNQNNKTARIIVQGPFEMRSNIERVMNRIAENIVVGNEAVVTAKK
ncbi:hypothetical protein IT570_02750 [Candidatus Sumerlaeota bacterium]|nr:hypothetical protein [Candidatus Sumerlaeota bacterium]